jgi:hypothetical protein
VTIRKPRKQQKPKNPEQKQRPRSPVMTDESEIPADILGFIETCRVLNEQRCMEAFTYDCKHSPVNHRTPQSKSTAFFPNLAANAEQRPETHPIAPALYLRHPDDMEID